VYTGVGTGIAKMTRATTIVPLTKKNGKKKIKKKKKKKKKKKCKFM